MWQLHSGSFAAYFLREFKKINHSNDFKYEKLADSYYMNWYIFHHLGDGHVFNLFYALFCSVAMVKAYPLI